MHILLQPDIEISVQTHQRTKKITKHIPMFYFNLSLNSLNESDTINKRDITYSIAQPPGEAESPGICA